MAERWFFALWPDGATGTALSARARPLIPTGARAAHPLDLHLTLHFLGELTPEQVQLAVAAADEVRSHAFSLRIDRVGYFPGPRALWCGPSRWPTALSKLTSRLGQGLTERGFAPETRPFHPHITLARKVRGGISVDWGQAVDWEPSDLCLARGCDGQAPRYAVAHRWPLAPGTDGAPP